MKKEISFLFFITVLLFHVSYSQQAVLTGHLHLDSSWAKKIYISRLPDFNLMFAASDRFIIAEGIIDPSGNFTIPFPSSENETLYRLHIVKSNDPVSTLIIGGPEENHAFFITKNAEPVYFLNKDSGKILSQSYVQGGKTNDELNVLLSLINGQSANRDSLKSQLIATVEKSSSELVGLLAVYSSFGLTSKQESTIKIALKKYNDGNPYGKKIFEEYKSKNNRSLILLIVLLCASAGVFYATRYYRKKNTYTLIQSLSQRELVIARLIAEGKANKEIASELNVELSTVKTHVNNIYSKLKIGNRKELLKYRTTLKN